MSQTKTKQNITKGKNMNLTKSEQKITQNENISKPEEKLTKDENTKPEKTFTKCSYTDFRERLENKEVNEILEDFENSGLEIKTFLLDSSVDFSNLTDLNVLSKIMFALSYALGGRLNRMICYVDDVKSGYKFEGKLVSLEHKEAIQHIENLTKFIKLFKKIGIDMNKKSKTVKFCKDKNRCKNIECKFQHPDTCKHFLELGKCKFNEQGKCKFSHWI